MPLNIPSYTENNFSFGPGRLFLGAAGTTPTVDVGAITEDGISIEPVNEVRDIRQGNPKLPIYTFSQQQDVLVKATGIEWNLLTLPYALGAGNTTSAAGSDTLTYGGDPLVKKVALHVQHQMAVTGNTLDVYVWQATMNGTPPTFGLGHDEHQFSMEFKAQRVTTDWAGASLAATAQLMKIIRTKQ